MTTIGMRPGDIRPGGLQPATRRARPRRRAPVRRETLLVCGIVSVLLYVVMNVVVALQSPGYSAVSQTVSELSAIGAPTRPLWVVLALPYTILVIGFGWGVWRSARDRRALRVTGALLLAYGLLGVVRPFAPMHLRPVLAAGGGTASDVAHITLGCATVALMLLAIGFGAAALGARFRRYSIATLVVVLVFGILTGIDAPAVGANRPTPWLGVWERVDIAAFLAWTVVLALMLIPRIPETTSRRTVSKS